MRILVLRVPTSDGELAADRLWSAGARAVEEIATDDDGPTVVLRTVLAGSDDMSLVRIGETPPTWNIEFVDAEDAPTEAWRDHVAPIEVHPGLILRPAWLVPVGRPGTLEIAIEPGGSFGLGDHPTTRLSAAAVDRLVRPGDRVLDVGTGSGVLAIIAARRGASTVTAIDIAEAAREATDANAARNGVADLVRAATTPVHEIGGVFDLVVANILAPALVGLAEELRRLTAPHGSLVVSGILADRHDHVLEALAPMRLIERSVADGWAAVELRHG